MDGTEVKLNNIFKRKFRQLKNQDEDDILYFKKFNKFKRLSNLLAVSKSLHRQILESYHSSQTNKIKVIREVIFRNEITDNKITINENELEEINNLSEITNENNLDK